MHRLYFHVQSVRVWHKHTVSRVNKCPGSWWNILSCTWPTCWSNARELSRLSRPVWSGTLHQKWDGKNVLWRHSKGLPPWSKRPQVKVVSVRLTLTRVNKIHLVHWMDWDAGVISKTCVSPDRFVCLWQQLQVTCKKVSKWGLSFSKMVSALSRQDRLCSTLNSCKTQPVSTSDLNSKTLPCMASSDNV